MKSIRNIKFVPVNDEGYKNYVAGFIRKKNQKRQVTDAIAVAIEDPVFDASRTLERIVRNMVGNSEIERVICYESYDGWRWTRHYAECDFVKGGFSCAALIMGCFLFTLPVHRPDHFYSPNHPLPQAENLSIPLPRI